jgi:hypothetical protein
VAPVCSNCGASDFVWANDLKTGSRGSGGLSLRAKGELDMGTRICRGCGHADLFLKDPSVLRLPHTWRPGEFTPIPSRPPAVAPTPAAPRPAPVPAPTPTPVAPPAPPTPPPASPAAPPLSDPTPPAEPPAPESAPASSAPSGADENGGAPDASVKKGRRRGRAKSGDTSSGSS